VSTKERTVSSFFTTPMRTPPPITRHVTGKKFFLSVTSVKLGYLTGDIGLGDDECD
jgi:hypothetical protein